MPLSSILIVGLGNPGREYNDTWHNAGFWVLNHIAQKWNCSFQQSRYDYQYCKWVFENRNVYLIKPTTFMNLSGFSVVQALNFYKISHDDMLVIYDDHDLNLGSIRIRTSGSDGGHRGMKSIIEQLSSTQFPRIRIGIRKSQERVEKSLATTVLSNPHERDRTIIQEVIEKCCGAVESYVVNGIQQTMNKFNVKTKPADDTVKKK